MAPPRPEQCCNTPANREKEERGRWWFAFWLRVLFHPLGKAFFFTFSMGGTGFYPVLLGYRTQMTISEINNLILADAAIREKDWDRWWKIILATDLRAFVRLTSVPLGWVAWSTLEGLRLGIYFPVPTFSCAVAECFELIGLCYLDPTVINKRWVGFSVRLV